MARHQFSNLNFEGIFVESIFSSSYLFLCLATIIVVVVGIFAPVVVESGRLDETTDDEMSKFHCHVFGWAILAGGLGVLFSVLAGWADHWVALCGELALFGFAYFVGLLANEHDKAVFRQRCRAVHRRYCDSLMAFFATRSERKRLNKPDLSFMKKVEEHACWQQPQRTIAMRIHFARCLLGIHAPTYELEAMVIRYVRAGGSP